MINLSKYYSGKLKLSKSQINREFFLLIAILFLFIGLIARTFYVSYFKHKDYTNIVVAQATPASTSIQYKRGTITDRNGTVLAISEKLYNIILDPKVLMTYENKRKEKDESYVENTIKALVECFDLDASKIYEILNEKSDSSYVILAKNIKKENVDTFESLDNIYIKGIWFETTYKRTYPYNSLACNVIGYTVSNNQGQTGIEEKYNETLNGEMGSIDYFIDSNLEEGKVKKDAVNGENITSTIDINIQGIVEDKIKNFLEEYKDGYVSGVGAKRIGVVIMNPQNGEILAMANSNTFDLNNPYSLSDNGYCSEEEENSMTDEEKLDKLNQMWRNFCISDGYEPGSTMKPITLSMALNENLISQNSTFYCDGYQQIGKHHIKCAKRTGHGTISMDGVLMFSCNDAIMQIAEKIGKEKYCDYQNLFGFGQKTNIDLPGEASNSSTTYSVEKMGPTELATNSFGQGFNTSMVQIISAFSATINGGVYYQPHVVKEITNENGEITTPEWNSHPVISESVSNIVKQALYNTMYGKTDANGNNPTAKIARIAGYSMGGKTGTAEKLPRGNGKYLVSFIGAAPMNLSDNPEIVCYVVVDEPNVEKQASSSYAQILYKNIMKEVLPYMNIKKDNEVPEDMEEEYEEDKNIFLSDVVTEETSNYVFH